jgi:uncharacterized SAM-binding protein YcdF (DUF218 family)
VERSWAILVPGSGRRDSEGAYRIGGRAQACVAAAARLAERHPPRLVLFTGYSPVGGPSEAEQMLDAWPGSREIELLTETTARITAENMSRSLPLLLERRITDVTLVCGALHLPRVRYFFGGVYPRYGVRCHYAVTRQLPTPRAVAWEAGAIPLARRQRAVALTELTRLLSRSA